MVCCFFCSLCALTDIVSPLHIIQCTPSKASMGATCMFAAIPATSTGSGFRYSVGCGGDLQFCPALEPGRYRMHCPVAKTDNYLFVRREATEEDEPCQVKLAVSDMVVRPGDQLKTFYAAHGKLHFDIYPRILAPSSFCGCRRIWTSTLSSIYQQKSGPNLFRQSKSSSFQPFRSYSKRMWSPCCSSHYKR